MLTCFRCKKAINDPETLFTHIKKDHKICGNNCMVQCTICWKTFSNFSSFKQNVTKCFATAETVEEVQDDSDLYMYAVNTEISNFETTLKEAAILLACDLSAKMNWPRQDVFTTVSKVKNYFISRLTSGIEEIILPKIIPGNEDLVENFIKAIESSIEEVETEYRLELALKTKDLIYPSSQFEIIDIKLPKTKKTRKKRKKLLEVEEVVDGSKKNDQKKPRNKRKNSEGSEGTEDSDDSEHSEGPEESQVGEDIGVNIEEDEFMIEKGMITVMPIEFQIKKFFELPNVLKKVQLNTSKIQEGTKIDHFIKGRLWKEKLKNYKPDQVVIPFHFYGDGAQINNPLGTHTKSGEQQFNYYSFPTIPTQYLSRLENIFVAQIYPAKYHQRFTTERIYNNIIDIFTSLAENGICLNINGENIEVFFVCGLFIGDNKEQNQRLGFVGSFSRGNYHCRYCKMHREDMRKMDSSVQAMRRNRANYDIDVVTNKQEDTGIKEYSVFNRIPFFHVTESSSADLAHDVTEGTLHTILTLCINYFIEKKYFDIDYLNRRMSSMDFGEIEKGNLPVEITIEKLESGKLKMTSSEMFFFAHHFTLMMGERVPHDDPAWHLILTTIKFLDLCYLPSYDQDDIKALTDESKILNRNLMTLFSVNLKHKSHLSTHYDELTLDYGPLRYVQTIRFEGKHKEVKSYAKNTNSRLNLPKSLAIKMQFQFAFRLLQREGLEDRIHVPKYTESSIESKVYYTTLLPSIHLDEILQAECFFAPKIVLNGITFSLNLWLPNVDAENKTISEIVDIVILRMNEISKIFVVCKTYAVAYEDHYRSYRVRMESLQNDMAVINVSEFLSQHYYPVKIHNIGDNYFFRCKRF